MKFEKNFEPIKIPITAVCVDLPLYSQKAVYDYFITPIGNTYREKIVIKNRGNTAIRIQASFPKEMKNYFELNTTLGFVQGNSEFEIWTKFMPKEQIYIEGQKYINNDIFELPIKVKGSGQSVPIICCMKATLTRPEIKFSVPLIDFGEVTEYMASQVRIKISNICKLPQRICFINVPKEIHIEPNLGQATIFPDETIAVNFNYRIIENFEIQFGHVEGNIRYRVITGELFNYESQLKFVAERKKAEIVIDKYWIAFPKCEENLRKEAVIKVSNLTNESYIINIASPDKSVSGIRLDPSIFTLKGSTHTLVVLSYEASIMDLDPFELAEKSAKPIEKNELNEEEKLKLDEKGKNIKLEKFIQDKLSESAMKSAEKGKKEQKKKEEKKTVSVKKEEKKVSEKKKSKKQLEEEEILRQKEEEERKQKEEERKRIIMESFNKDAELEKRGGFVIEKKDDFSRTQTYQWLVPFFYRPVKSDVNKYKTCHISVRTVTWKMIQKIEEKKEEEKKEASEANEENEENNENEEVEKK